MQKPCGFAHRGIKVIDMVFLYTVCKPLQIHPCDPDGQRDTDGASNAGQNHIATDVPPCLVRYIRAKNLPHGNLFGVLISEVSTHSQQAQEGN